MYYQLSDKHDPHQPIFTWGTGTSFAYHLPNRKEPRQVVKAISSYYVNSRMGFVPEELVSRVSGMYDYYYLELYDYKEQLNYYKNAILSNPAYSEEAKRDFQQKEAKKFREYKQTLAREVLARIAKRVKLFKPLDRKAGQSFELLYLLISFVMAVRLPCNIMKDKSCTERLAVWMNECWYMTPFQKPRPWDCGVKMLEYFLAGKFMDALRQSERLAEAYKSRPKNEERLRVTKDLLVLKTHLHNNYENALISYPERKKQLQLLKEHCRNAINEYFPKDDPEDPCFVILAIMAGDLDVMKQVSKTDWKQYLFLHLTFGNPFTEFAEISTILQNYLNDIGYSSEESEFALKLFQPSLHSVTQWALTRIPLVFAVTFGLICFDLGLVKTCFEKDILGCSYPHHLLEYLTSWMMEVDFPTAFTYARQYGSYLGSTQYREFFTTLISHRIEIRLITNAEECDKFDSECVTIYSLGLYEYMNDFLRSTLIHHIKNDSFEYIFELLTSYETYSEIKEPLGWLRSQCDRLLRQKELDYHALLNAISNIRSDCKYKKESVERIFEIYFKVLAFEQYTSPYKLAGLLKELLEHPRVLIAFKQIMEIMSKHVQTHQGYPCLPSLKLLSAFLTERLYKESANHEPEIRQLLKEVADMTPPGL